MMPDTGLVNCAVELSGKDIAGPMREIVSRKAQQVVEVRARPSHERQENQNVLNTESLDGEAQQVTVERARDEIVRLTAEKKDLLDKIAGQQSLLDECPASTASVETQATVETTESLYSDVISGEWLSRAHKKADKKKQVRSLLIGQSHIAAEKVRLTEQIEIRQRALNAMEAEFCQASQRKKQQEQAAADSDATIQEKTVVIGDMKEVAQGLQEALDAQKDLLNAKKQALVDARALREKELAEKGHLKIEVSSYFTFMKSKDFKSLAYIKFNERTFTPNKVGAYIVIADGESVEIKAHGGFEMHRECWYGLFLAALFLKEHYSPLRSDFTGPRDFMAVISVGHTTELVDLQNLIYSEGGFDYFLEDCAGHAGRLSKDYCENCYSDSEGCENCCSDSEGCEKGSFRNSVCYIAEWLIKELKSHYPYYRISGPDSCFSDSEDCLESLVKDGGEGRALKNSWESDTPSAYYEAKHAKIIEALEGEIEEIDEKLKNLEQDLVASDSAIAQEELCLLAARDAKASAEAAASKEHSLMREIKENRIDPMQNSLVRAKSRLRRINAAIDVGADDVPDVSSSESAGMTPEAYDLIQAQLQQNRTKLGEIEVALAEAQMIVSGSAVQSSNARMTTPVLNAIRTEVPGDPLSSEEVLE